MHVEGNSKQGVRSRSGLKGLNAYRRDGKFTWKQNPNIARSTNPVLINQSTVWEGVVWEYEGC
jgi:hypothetical protein